MLVKGSYNSAFGSASLAYAITGNSNTAIGFSAGSETNTGTLTDSNDGVFVGDNSKALADVSVNEIVIGANTIGNGSNTVTLGNDSIVSSHLKGVYILSEQTEPVDGTIPTGKMAFYLDNVTGNAMVKFSNNNLVTVATDVGP